MSCRANTLLLLRAVAWERLPDAVLVNVLAAIPDAIPLADDTVAEVQRTIRNGGSDGRHVSQHPLHP